MSDVRGGESDEILAWLIVVLRDVVGGTGENGDGVCVFLDSYAEAS